MPEKQKSLKVVAIVCLLVVSTGAGYLAARLYSGAGEQAKIEGLLWPGSIEVRAFSTLDHTGREFNLDRLRGKWSFLFFGYTHCPDVCPMTLAVLDQFYEQAGISGQTADMQVVFITVDPERDTAAQLGNYVGYFDQDFIGLGGTPEQIQGLAGQLGVAYMRGQEMDTGNYLMDHTASVLLTDPGGRLVAVFSSPHDAETIYSRWQQIKDFINAQ